MTMELPPLCEAPLTACTPEIISIVVVSVAILSSCWSLLRKLDEVQPISDKLEQDISLPLAWPFRVIGCILDHFVHPWTGTLWDVSDAEGLLLQGSIEAGLSPAGYSPSVRESIHKFCESLEANNVELSWVGRKNLYFIIISGLSEYLKLYHLAKTKPDLFQTKLNDPIIVMGLPRSGTTHLHRLLNEVTPESLSIPLWQHFYPVPPQEETKNSSYWWWPWNRRVDFRRLKMHVNFLGWRFVANRYGMDTMHMVRPDLPDECHYSLRLGAGGFLPWHMAPVFDYLEWMMSKEAYPTVHHSYETYRLVLQLIQANNPNKMFVLKCPSHMFNMKILRDVIPEAKFVITHRDPCKTSLSYCSLNVRTQTAGCKSIDWKRAVDMNQLKDVLASKGLVKYIQEEQENKKFENTKVNCIHHVSYKQLVSNPIDLVRGTFEALEISPTEGYDQMIQTYVAKNKQNSKGVHHYSYQGMGLDKKEMEASFEAYTTFFAEYL